MSADDDREKGDVVRAAMQMIATAGDGAEARARLRADRLAVAGEGAAAALWARIADEIRSRSRMRTAPRDLGGRPAASCFDPP